MADTTTIYGGSSQLLAANRSKLMTTLNTLAGVNSQLAFKNQEYMLQAELFGTVTADEEKEIGIINTYNTDINNKLDARDKYEAANNPLCNTYCVEEFIVTNQGMCGMGMGMGKFGSNKIQLSGKELATLSLILCENEGSQASDVVTKLKEAGIDAKETAVTVKDENGNVVNGASKTGVEISHTNKDGTVTKTVVYDANGNGGLDTQDYNFNKALTEFETDLSKFKCEINKMDTEINAVKKERDPHVQTLTDLTQKGDLINQKMNIIDASIKQLDTECECLETVYEITEQTMAQIAMKNSEQYAADCERMGATATKDVDEAETAVNGIADATKKAEAQTKVDEMKAELKKIEEQTAIAVAAAASAKADAEAAATETDETKKKTLIESAMKSEKAARAAKEIVIDCLVKISGLKSEVMALSGSSNNNNNDDVKTETKTETKMTPLEALKDLVDRVRNDDVNDSETETVSLGQFEKIYNDAAGNSTLQKKIKQEIEDATGYDFDTFKKVVEFTEDWIKTHTTNGVTTWGQLFEASLAANLDNRPSSAYVNNFNTNSGGIIRKLDNIIA